MVPPQPNFISKHMKITIFHFIHAPCGMHGFITIGCRFIFYYFSVKIKIINCVVVYKDISITRKLKVVCAKQREKEGLESNLNGVYINTIFFFL